MSIFFSKNKKIKCEKIPCVFAPLCYSKSMKDEMNLLMRKALFRLACFCKGRADYAARRNQIGRAKLFMAVWEKSLDFRDLLR